jgi:3,4-dihydroxy 2-butanone 4-phosphate synthase/GTP cyclohydrolase II
MLNEKIQAVLNDVRSGRPIIITDSNSREDEGDIMIAAEKATYETISFMALWGRGIMCLPCTSDRLEKLDIPMMYSNKLDKFTTPFANSIDAAHGISTGVSVSDRLQTIKLFVDDASKPEEFAQPGHLFPLRARLGLLEERQGHTESSVELCNLAGMKPVAVIIEVMLPTGEMARVPDLTKFCQHFGLKMISIDEIIEYKHGKHENASI